MEHRFFTEKVFLDAAYGEISHEEYLKQFVPQEFYYKRDSSIPQKVLQSSWEGLKVTHLIDIIRGKEMFTGDHLTDEEKGYKVVIGTVDTALTAFGVGLVAKPGSGTFCKGIMIASVQDMGINATYTMMNETGFEDWAKAVSLGMTALSLYSIYQYGKAYKNGVKGNVPESEVPKVSVNDVPKVENNYRSNVRKINGQRTSKYRQLTDQEILQLLDDIDALGAETSIFRFNEGNQTGFLDSEGIINVRGDVLPDLNSTHPRDLMSARAVLAHEYYGHKYYDDVFGIQNPMPGSWNDEFRASYNAAINAPNLSDMDRAYLMSDALERAKEAGVNIRITDEIRRVLYGY